MIGLHQALSSTQYAFSMNGASTHWNKQPRSPPQGLSSPLNSYLQSITKSYWVYLLKTVSFVSALLDLRCYFPNLSLSGRLPS